MYVDIIDRLDAQNAYLAKFFPGPNLKYVSEAYMAKLFDELFVEAVADLRKSLNGIYIMTSYDGNGTPATPDGILAIKKANIKAYYGRLLRLSQAMQPLRVRYGFAPMPPKNKLDIREYATYLVEALA